MVSKGVLKLICDDSNGLPGCGKSISGRVVGTWAHTWCETNGYVLLPSSETEAVMPAAQIAAAEKEDITRAKAGIVLVTGEKTKLLQELADERKEVSRLRLELSRAEQTIESNQVQIAYAESVERETSGRSIRHRPTLNETTPTPATRLNDADWPKPRPLPSSQQQHRVNSERRRPDALPPLPPQTLRTGPSGARDDPTQHPPTGHASPLIEIAFVRSRKVSNREKKIGRHVRLVCPGNMVQGVTSIGKEKIALLVRAQVKHKVIARMQQAGYTHDPAFRMMLPQRSGMTSVKPSREEVEFAASASFRRCTGAARYNRYVPAQRFYQARANEIAATHPSICRRVEQSQENASDQRRARELERKRQHAAPKLTDDLRGGGAKAADGYRGIQQNDRSGDWHACLQSPNSAPGGKGANERDVSEPPSQADMLPDNSPPALCPTSTDFTTPRTGPGGQSAA